MASPPTRLDPDRPADDRPTDHRVEWWYFFGHVRSTDPARPGAWSFVTSLLKKRLAFPGWPTAWLAATQVVDTRRIVRRCTGGLPSPFCYDRTGFRFGIAYGPGLPRWALSRTPGRWRLEYQRRAGLALDLEERGDVVRIGPRGVMDYGGGHALGWYTRPFLEAHGTVTDGGVAVPVQGHAWMERQWGFAPVERFAWRYLTLRLDNGRRILAFSTQVDGHHKTWGTHIFPDGRALPIDGIRLSPVPPAAPDTPPSTTVQGAGVDLLVAPLPVDQLIRPRVPGAPAFYEGFGNVAGTLDGEAVTGVGMTELRAPSGGLPGV